MVTIEQATAARYGQVFHCTDFRDGRECVVHSAPSRGGESVDPLTGIYETHGYSHNRSRRLWPRKLALVLGHQLGLKPNNPFGEHVKWFAVRDGYPEGTAYDTVDEAIQGCFRSHAWPSGPAIIYVVAETVILCGDCMQMHYRQTGDAGYGDVADTHDLEYDIECEACGATLAPAYRDDDEDE